jgi:chemotaxis signal transduction protein
MSVESREHASQPPGFGAQGTAREETAVGLECLAGKARIAIPVDSVAQILEYSVTPHLPLARSFVGGLALHEGRLIVSVRLSKRSVETPSYTTKGILLQVDGDLAWALEAVEIGSFVRVTIQARRPQHGPDKLPAWVTAATTEEGATLGWIDVDQMIADLGRDRRS